MAEVIKSLPEKASAIEPVVAKFQKAFAACRPAVQFAAQASSPEDNAKAAGRLKAECVPPIQ